MMARYMYLGDPRLEIVNEMLRQPKLFIGPEAYDAAKSLAFARLYSPSTADILAMYGSKKAFDDTGTCHYGRCSCTLGICRGLGQHHNRKGGDMNGDMAVTSRHYAVT